ncbi:CRISPR-associated endonuclease Cas2 [Thiospirochaeta perfilievii]|uniref:CRISPR-associated endoribonuclease Cas2 n=1 Tax=Thiospirochaeta perfilievii TaxID=252967 RepID=A0A5C1QB52_9SPIO|nr:CRISPR-associated endonuclease Cas2 [Thiospirochaeta perfilievii]QEN04727.1 CRISPR-associated endonuclease Cas2 [Thiospirochaeta perfilievii]
MRVLLFFDLPMETPKERYFYNRFRRSLLKEGFIMQQKSVYTKLALNSSSVNLIKSRIKKDLPPNGLVQVLVVTERQFSSVDTFIGEVHYSNLDSTDRLIIL